MMDGEMKPLSNEQIVAIYGRAIDLIERGWCQGHMAVDSEGNECDVDDGKACAWCLTGAVRKVVIKGADEFWPGRCIDFVADDVWEDVWFPLREAVYVQSQNQTVSLWEYNDYPAVTAHRVVALIERAMKLVEKKEEAKW